MDWKDALTLGTTIVTSLGGGGVIVFKLSGYLGRVWADRALEKDRFEYGQLRSKLEADLRNASQFLQAELDKLSLIHKLRRKVNFSGWQRCGRTLPISGRRLLESRASRVQAK